MKVSKKKNEGNYRGVKINLIYLQRQVENQKWGSWYIDELAKFISMNCPEIKGFNRCGLYRMKQFYETYKGNEFVSTLLTQISR
jgi:hypothetical protein